MILHNLPLSTPGQRLIAARTHIGLKDPAVAAKDVGTTLATLLRHEAGDTSFIGRSAESYGDTYRVSRDWLMFGTPADAPVWADPVRRAFSAWLEASSLNVSRVAYGARTEKGPIYRWRKGDACDLRGDVRAKIVATYLTAPFDVRPMDVYPL